MNYEKLYKDALERARQCLDKGHPDTCFVRPDIIFPELAESDDERIRKWIINHLEYNFLNTSIADERIKCKEAIAWLEKQGDKDRLIKELGEYKVKYIQEVLEKHINSMSNKDDERLRKTTIAFLKDFAEQGYENAVECIDWLKKQGEQKINSYE